MTATAYIEGPACWTPQLPDWAAARAAFRADEVPEAVATRVPRPQLLAAGDRRRAPEAVALALEAGRMALESTRRSGDELLAVFASAHGDLGIVDAMCRTLAETPRQVSPTRFLNSIHNAPAGMWSMAVQCMRANTAVAAGSASFATGLLEALMLCTVEQRGVLFVACETAATGPLTATIGRQTPVASALILTPQASPDAVASLTWVLDNAAGCGACEPRTRPGRALAAGGLGDGARLLEMLARDERGSCRQALSGGQCLALELASGAPGQS